MRMLVSLLFILFTLNSCVSPSAVPQNSMDSSESKPTLLPPDQQIPEDDTLLLHLSSDYCKAGAPQSQEWKTWEQGLRDQLQTYWRALVASCQNEVSLAIKLFQDIIPKLAHQKPLHDYAIVSCEWLVKLQIRSAQRAESILTYKKLAKLWEQDISKHESTPAFYESETELKFLDDILSAARAETTVEDYGDADILVKRALKHLEKAIKISQGHKNTKFLAKLIQLKAEAFQVLANRIHLEKKELSAAAKAAGQGLHIPKLPKEWVERFTFTRGLYTFLAGNKLAARKIWTTHLAKHPSSEYKPKLYYWITRTFTAKEKPARRKYLLKLEKEYPFDLYTLLSKKFVGKDPEECLEDFFGNVNKLQDTIDWNSENARLCLSRQLFLQSDYRASIALTTNLSLNSPEFWKKNPEQVLIYYPRPFLEIYKRKADKYALSLALLYGISRQESKFNPEAQSYAGALGLMQILPATGKRMASDPDFEKMEANKDLLNAALNLELGARYLKTLHKHYKGDEISVIAAYNAGEFVVDRWLKNRPHKDVQAWIELIPFQETRQYVLAVMHNTYMYKFLNAELGTVVFERTMDYKKRAQLSKHEGHAL